MRSSGSSEQCSATCSLLWKSNSGCFRICGRLVRYAIDELRRTEIVRAAAADAVAAALGLPAAPSLAALAAQVDEPWRSIMTDQRAALIVAMSAIDRVSTSAIEVLEGVRASVRPE